MRIEIDTKNKTIKVLEDISINELVATLETMFSKRELREYKISASTYTYYPATTWINQPYEVTCYDSAVTTHYPEGTSFTLTN